MGGHSPRPRDLTPVPTVDELAERLLAGDRRALSRMLTVIEDDGPPAHRAMARLYPASGNAHTVGLTGSAGSGKSTLNGALARELRARGKSLGIVAIDPTSPFSQGALLGDRIRMQDLTSDPGVFLRSMATRGNMGGLAPTTAGVVTALDAYGKDIVLVETVGAGQDEVDVAAMTDTTVVVLTPGAGDDVQAMKAGMMEIADILVVNKCDLPNADLVARQLIALYESAPASADGWQPPVLRTAGALREGIGELADALEAHRAHIAGKGVRERHRLEQAQHQVLALARQRVVDGMLSRAGAAARLDALVTQVANRELDPHAAAGQLVEGN